MPPPSKIDLYERSGIIDVGEFYRYKFVSDEVLDSRYFKTLDRFDIRFARTMWVYDNIRSGAAVLDLGCGAGMLALLKRKDVFLVGVDLSNECAQAAKANGYDAAYVADLMDLPFAANSFDYVVSLDVFGHVDLEKKDAVLQEIKRVLRPRGVTLHGIESTDRLVQKSYEEMTPDELRRFVEIDGHVGLEGESEHAERFQRFFSYVAFEPRYALCLSCEEFLKQADKYGLHFEVDFLDYLRGLSFKERRAFDIAMGYVFNKISDLHIKIPPSGLYTFVKASDEPLGPFYNEHRDRTALFAFGTVEVGSVCLDRSSEAVFDDGWFEPNNLPPIARWMGKCARVRFRTPTLSTISLDLTTHIPEICTKPMVVELSLNARMLSNFSLFNYGWLNVQIDVPADLTFEADGAFELELKASRTWEPRPTNDETRDDREISIAVCNIELRP